MAYVEYSWISKRGHLWVLKKIWFSWSNRQLISEFTSVLLPAFWKVVLFKKKIFIYLAALGLSCCIWDLLLQHSNSLVVAYSLSCSTLCGILVLWPEIKPRSLHWKVRFLTTDYQGSPQGSTFFFFFNLFIFGCPGPWLLCVGLPHRAVSGVCSALRCSGFSLRWLLLLQSISLGTRAPVIAPHRLSSCSSWA